MKSKLSLDKLTKKDVIRIDVILHPRDDDPEWEGIFEWRHDKDKYTVNLDLLRKEIEQYFPGRSETISTQLMNFPRVYLIIPTGEVLSSHIEE